MTILVKYLTDQMPPHLGWKAYFRRTPAPGFQFIRGEGENEEIVNWLPGYTQYFATPEQENEVEHLWRFASVVLPGRADPDTSYFPLSCYREVCLNKICQRFSLQFHKYFSAQLSLTKTTCWNSISTEFP